MAPSFQLPRLLVVWSGSHHLPCRLLCTKSTALQTLGELQLVWRVQEAERRQKTVAQPGMPCRPVQQTLQQLLLNKLLSRSPGQTQAHHA